MTRILIIEDNQANMELMVYLLAAFGYAVESTTSGKQGLDKAMETVPDLIICDLQMPGMDGYEVIRRLKGHAQLKDVPVVAVTAYAMVGDRDRVLAQGFEGYLSKPINSETFVQQIEVFLPLEKKRTRTPTLSARESAPAAARHPTQKAAILVVDDSPINRSLIESTLVPSGYSVRSMENVAEAMAALSENCFDLIVSDLHMNPESGLDFLRKVKADPTLSSIPFFLFSASSLEEASAERQRAWELGATKFLSRPVEPKTLLSVIEEFLVQPRAEQHAHRPDR
jgi:two-component system cell cycle response regulator